MKKTLNTIKNICALIILMVIIVCMALTAIKARDNGNLIQFGLYTILTVGLLEMTMSCTKQKKGGGRIASKKAKINGTAETFR